MYAKCAMECTNVLLPFTIVAKRLRIWSHRDDVYEYWILFPFVESACHTYIIIYKEISATKVLIYAMFLFLDGCLREGLALVHVSGPTCGRGATTVQFPTLTFPWYHSNCNLPPTGCWRAADLTEEKNVHFCLGKTAANSAAPNWNSAQAAASTQFKCQTLQSSMAAPHFEWGARKDMQKNIQEAVMQGRWTHHPRSAFALGGFFSSSHLSPRTFACWC